MHNGDRELAFGLRSVSQRLLELQELPTHYRAVLVGE